MAIARSFFFGVWIPGDGESDRRSARASPQTNGSEAKAGTGTYTGTTGSRQTSRPSNQPSDGLCRSLRQFGGARRLTPGSQAINGRAGHTFGGHARGFAAITRLARWACASESSGRASGPRGAAAQSPINFRAAIQPPSPTDEQPFSTCFRAQSLGTGPAPPRIRLPAPWRALLAHRRHRLYSWISGCA